TLVQTDEAHPDTRSAARTRARSGRMPCESSGMGRYSGEVSPGSILVLLAALGVVVLDIALGSAWTGLLVSFAMATVALAVAEAGRQMVAVRRRAAELSGVLWFEASLLLALVGFLVARVLILAEQFAGTAGERAIAAAETYDLVFTTMAAIAGGLV